MNTRSRVGAVIVAGASLVVLSGCSLDTALWGADGARVIDTTEQLIDAASSGAQDTLACEGSAADFGDSQAWEELSAGEPEEFNAATSVDRPSLDAAWRINLEGTATRRVSGEVSPTDVFYREVNDGLCVADIIWQTIDLGAKDGFRTPSE